MLNKDLTSLKNEIKKASDSVQAIGLQRFFKTGPGEYGEGDIFAGLKVPVSRSIALKFKHLSLQDISILIKSKIHEERLIALFILIAKYKKETETGKEKIFRFYLKNRKYINNWDLVDLSAPNIPGDFLKDKNKDLLYEYAHSKNLWERRIAILSTFAFIRSGDFSHTFAVSDILLHDKHDLIHKAVGWMLREAGKRDYGSLEEFLIPRYASMPRTMLRYAIEKLPEKRRKEFLLGKI
jgi:3-methyladenine DNA glycosylase AlkD